MSTTSHINECKLWFPSTATYTAATAKVTMKSFEHGNTVMKSRNQTIARNRAGASVVFDRGTNYNDVMVWQFRQMTDTERSNLIAFLSAVEWGSNRIKVRDYKGSEYVVRINKPEVTSADTGYTQYTDAGVILWDFDLEVIDLTGLDDETGEDAPVSSALALHLMDVDHPHNPETELANLDIADGSTIVESIVVRDWKAATWLIVAEKDANRLYTMVHVASDGYATTDATALTTPTISTLADTGGVAAIITYTTTLTGAAAAQVMNIKAATTVDGYKIRCRRFKL